jgi:pimeloyl-ACP methyl ester carboxylesterase
MTTQADGVFSFTGLLQGAVAIRITAAGFDTLQRGMLLAPGSNAQTLMLRRVNTILESGLFTTWLPSGASVYRGVFVFLYGGFSDARPMIRGDLDFYKAVPAGADQVFEHRQLLVAFGRAHGFAIVGTVTPQNPQSLYTDIRVALEDVGNRSGHTELAHAPLLIMGHSRGGCMAYQLAVQAADRVIGVLPLAGAGVEPCFEGSPDPSVPVYIIFGASDLAGVAPASTAVFTEHRGRGGLWALAIEAGAGHQWPPATLLFNWAEAVTVRRLPETVVAGAPVQLGTISESSGWLADRTSHAIAPFPCFTGNRTAASWVPTEPSAREWQAISALGSGATVGQCPQ